MHLIYTTCILLCWRIIEMGRYDRFLEILTKFDPLFT